MRGSSALGGEISRPSRCPSGSAASCLLLSHEDKKSLTFDSGGTEAHPATDAILFGASAE